MNVVSACAGCSVVVKTVCRILAAIFFLTLAISPHPAVTFFVLP